MSHARGLCSSIRLLEQAALGSPHFGSRWRLLPFSGLIRRPSKLKESDAEGTTAHIASRALSVQNIIYDETVNSKENLELSELAAEIEKVDEMINDMEMKVNVLRWTVEASGGQEDELFSNEASSLTLISVEEGGIQRCCHGGKYIVTLILCGAALVAMTLSVSVVHLA